VQGPQAQVQLQLRWRVGVAERCWPRP
jgi:hypothetical protein